MTAEQFAYWLQGFVELTPDQTPTLAQWDSIKAHLQEVFVKRTPPVYNPGPAPTQDWLKRLSDIPKLDGIQITC